MLRSRSQALADGRPPTGGRPASRPQRLVFGEVADLYDRARPSYPSALVDHLVALAEDASGEEATGTGGGRVLDVGCGTGGGRVLDVGCGTGGGRVLDVGCGTGKAAVLLAGRGLAGMGAEPDPDMAAVARRNLAPYPRWSVEAVEFEAFPPALGPFDLVTCAQAWHWLDPFVRYAHAGRLLHPGGWLALFWNRTTTDDSAIRQAIDQVYAETFPHASPHGQLTAGQPPAGSPPPGSGLDFAGWQVFGWVARYTTAQWLDLVQTHSDHRMLAPEAQRLLLDRLAEVVEAHGGVFDHPYDCWLWSARRR